MTMKPTKATLKILTERIETLERTLALERALRWTAPVAPDVLPPGQASPLNLDERLPRSVWGSPYTSGYLYNSHTQVVDRAWSTSISHGRGYAAPVPNRSASRDSCALFSTRRRAYAAMRYDVERRAAEALAAIDRVMAALPEDETDAPDPAV